MPIGGVLATEQVIIPNAVGVDIGCGMVAVKTTLKDITREQIIDTMKIIRKTVPVGFNHQEEEQEWDGFDRAPNIEVIQKNIKSARKQIGTLGGGNHFIEIQKGNDGHIWLMIHSGSRNFGLQTANEYHKKAKSLCQKWQSDIPDPDLSFLPMDESVGREYREAMEYALEFARANRALMMERTKSALAEVVSLSSTDFEEFANIHHNYAAMENHYGKNVMVHRKGATLATDSTIGIIPGSMGTSSYIVKGLGNKESFNSCSHGAGRKMGRNHARRTLNLAEEQEKMGDIIGKPRSVDQLDEAPGAYKDIVSVMANQTDLVEILIKLTPLAVIKG